MHEHLTHRDLGRSSLLELLNKMLDSVHQSVGPLTEYREISVDFSDDV